MTMFITLLLVTFSISLLVSLLITVIFNKPIRAILDRIVQEDISRAWHRYLQFAIQVVGVSSGVRIWNLEKYITPQLTNQAIISLTAERWVLEIYRTVISSLQGIAWMLLVFFAFALIAFVLVRLFEIGANRARKA